MKRTCKMEHEILKTQSAHIFPIAKHDRADFPEFSRVRWCVSAVLASCVCVCVCVCVCAYAAVAACRAAVCASVTIARYARLEGPVACVCVCVCMCVCVCVCMSEFVPCVRP